MEVVSSLLAPRAKSNPGGFDYGGYLRARNIYGMTLPVKKAADIRVIGTGETNPLIKMSLTLKKKMTAVLRKTMPYPESAFLGGVTLGLRGGVPDEVKKQFQATGVAHVLAVSGLHVGFVAVLLLAISRVFGLPRKLTFIFVVFGLTVFAIITGASPATLRAVLMFSIGQFLFVRGFGIRRATVYTIPMSAFIILLPDLAQAARRQFCSFVCSGMVACTSVWSGGRIS